MSGPFANGTEGDMFVAHRCMRCAYWDHKVEAPCEGFTPAFFGQWPEILYRTTSTVVGVDCRNFLKVVDR